MMTRVITRRMIRRAAGLILAASFFEWCFTGISWGEESPAVYQYDSPVYGQSRCPPPEESMELGGKMVYLVSSELRSSWIDDRSKYAETIIPYQLEAIDQIPENASITINDDDTGEQYVRVLPLIEEQETGAFWDEDFTFLITVQNYDADYYFLGDLEIQKDDELLDYSGELLEYLGLPADSYEINSISWEGETFELDGTRCRNARASGRKLMRDVSAKYAGTIDLPPVLGNYYHCIYAEKVESEKEISQTKPAPFTEMTDTELAETENMNQAPVREQDSFGKRMERWLIEHLTVVRVSALLLITVILLILIILNKRRKEIKG